MKFNAKNGVQQMKKQANTKPKTLVAFCSLANSAAVEEEFLAFCNSIPVFSRNLSLNVLEECTIGELLFSSDLLDSGSEPLFKPIKACSIGLSYEMEVFVRLGNEPVVGFLCRSEGDLDDGGTSVPSSLSAVIMEDCLNDFDLCRFIVLRNPVELVRHNNDCCFNNCVVLMYVISIIKHGIMKANVEPYIM